MSPPRKKIFSNSPNFVFFMYLHLNAKLQKNVHQKVHVRHTSAIRRFVETIKFDVGIKTQFQIESRVDTDQVNGLFNVV